MKHKETRVVFTWLARALSKFKIDYQPAHEWCLYFKCIPVLPNLETITIIGLIHFAEIMELIRLMRMNTDRVLWLHECVPKGYTFKKTSY